MKASQNTAQLQPHKPKTKEQMAMEMDIHLKTLQRRLKRVGLDVPRGLIFPEQQMEIYHRLGWDK